ncbi:hypothetical protein [Domibacillus enclensis]|uniref:Uncharacterized protein n=1 Tax=Domibacillus enclensis TaxID=1017273 RepID=A0A1N6XYB3_9BACI|nr:hypothetical protein [Domibacillus enclensis]SIR07243.1 hypothetical protein SAMN05443094_10589 [Domibacillus enclensis]
MLVDRIIRQIDRNPMADDRKTMNPVIALSNPVHFSLFPVISRSKYIINSKATFTW